ncbi:MAG TPA: LacI family DNA-binding transcriptional regulator [Pseudolysinimonas sp.]|jgi:DNA-binding LacI/PurR family transcriptional regulator
MTAQSPEDVHVSSEQPSPAPKRRVTSADVAQASGVSRATVSYVLNEAPGRAISEKTRELVKTTAARLGHVPNAPARALRSGRSKIVLALLPSFSRGFVADRVLETLDISLSERGYALAAHRYDEDSRSLAELWGMISPSLVVAMAGLSLPEASVVESANARWVSVHDSLDHLRAGRMQIEYLVSAGHTKVGYLYADQAAVSIVADARWRGAQACAGELRLPPLVRCDIDPNEPELDGAIDTWLAAGVTAVCAHNDQMASMLLLAMHRRGLEAPGDLAIIGNDDSPIARFGLTTIAIDIEQYASYVVGAVLDSLDDRPVSPPPDFLRLVVRETA